jgi:hypothetical protein
MYLGIVFLNYRKILKTDIRKILENEKESLYNNHC